MAALAEAAWPPLLRRLDLTDAPAAAACPGPELFARVGPRPAALSRDFVRHLGGDPRAYVDVGHVPPHLFSQWCLPTLARTTRGLPFAMLEAVNGGCRLQLRGPLPAGEPLEVRARLEGIEDGGQRAVLRQRLSTGPAAAPDSLVADVFVVVPSGRRASRGSAPRKEPACVPATARELAYWTLGQSAGLAFALLTGDVNPVHWSRPWARAFGFDGVILHGFATMARAIEGLQRAVFGGAVDRLRVVDVRFTRPLGLPAHVGLYLDGARFYVGAAPGGPANLVGTFVEAGA